MKIKVYAILLLFSFLMVVVHGMVPHHHHEAEFFHETEEHTHHAATDHSHNGEEDHHHETPIKDTGDHQHSAPFHIHASVVHGYDFMKIKGNHDNHVVIELPSFLKTEQVLRIVPPPEIKDFRFKEFPISIPPEPASVASLLRGPPVFA